ncbi:MAG: Hsp70 family protein [Deltaproteobacteria bacterium]|nr:Hsp70 family protein [Deltaproteobacteria bacterium]
MSSERLVVGIDLGTTYSEVAAYVGDQVIVLGQDNRRIMPSCVGMSPDGQLLVGEAARNQYLLHPERTVRSVKRRMGSTERIQLGEQALLPEEISALILRELTDRASRELDQPVKQAVITVPAYFSDAQRSATREAGALAGLEVLRILNEPTAASLAYGFGDGQRRTAMVYDLGGGTFDVSIITTEADVTEVLASHGNTQLGGDDFDELLLGRLKAEFEQRHGLDLDRLALARLARAAEEAKQRLSFEPHVRIREDALVTVDGKPFHLDVEISREQYEDMIRPHIESTLESVSRALDDAGRSPGELDAILLAGGSTRTPLVWRLLEERTGLPPRQEVHPDLCVALGAGVLASRLSGRQVDRVLVDVSPYSFGPSHLGEMNGYPYPHCYRPIIRRNTPLPVTRTESYFTVVEYQTEVDVDVYQGDDPDALKNILVGHFRVSGLTPMEEQNEVLCRMSLDLDGCLQVTATEKLTGLSKQITITDAMAPKDEAEIETARGRLADLLSNRGAAVAALEGHLEAAGADPTAGCIDSVSLPDGRKRDRTRYEKLLERSQALLDSMHPDDRSEAVEIRAAVQQALDDRDEAALAEAGDRLEELLFYLEGR